MSRLGKDSGMCYVAASLALLVVVAGSVPAEDMLVTVYVDGKAQDFSPQARVRDGKTYAPLRAAAEAVGAHVSWQAASGMAVVCVGNQCVPVRKDQGIVVDNHLLIPLRLMAEALQCEVTWDGKNKAVHISTKKSELGAAVPTGCGPLG
ncbi:MAG: copper amine oxidase N-terminal domain-containing protein [Armatimonadetes bacterium]|nr:copper amine oxidase N-terminal domain-containing protein [Armatimonadota bacterium]